MGDTPRTSVCVEEIEQRRKLDWNPRAHVVSFASDFQRRVSGVQNQLGVCVHDGKRTITQFGQLIDSGREILAHRYSALAHGYTGRDTEQNFDGKKLWMSLLGLGAQIQARVERRRVERTESILDIVRELKDVHCRSSRPLFATLSLGSGIREVPVEAKHVFDLAMTSEQVAKRLDGVPVYTVSNAANEFVLISDLNTSKSLGIFCFREEDAEALLSQVKDREPSLGRGAKVVAVSLDKSQLDPMLQADEVEGRLWQLVTAMDEVDGLEPYVYQLNTEGIAFRFLPDPQQVKNALEARVKAGDAGRAFDGVPIFQSDNLILRSNNRRFCPIFFSKEDLENALKRAFKQQQKVNPALRVNTDIQVGSFEDVLKRMELKNAVGSRGSLSVPHIVKSNEEETGWGDIVFIPPGMDALSHLGNARGSVVG